MKTADILINIPVKSIVKAYTYFVPPELGELTPGWRVLVSFGKRKMEGFVIQVAEADDISELKPVLEKVDECPWFNETMLKTAHWMAEYYFCSQGEAMRLFMPGKSGLKIKSEYYVVDEAEAAVRNVGGRLAEIFAYLREHEPLSLRQLKKQFPEPAVNSYLQLMNREKWLHIEESIEKRSKEKYEKIYSLVPNIDFRVFSRRPVQLRAAELLQAADGMSADKLKQTGISAAVLKVMEGNGLVKAVKHRIYRNTYENYQEKRRSIALTAEQMVVCNELNGVIAAKKSQTFLLHGVTGSGKTQVYIEAVAAVRHQNRQAIVLVPEIALTSQIVKRFKAYFGEDVIVMHSKLSVSERNDVIMRFRMQEAGIVIGARSALFVPASDVGIIIMDEEHDSSYKQDESPRYHTRDVAGAMAAIYKSVLLLGSATPSVESYYKAQQGEYRLLEMKQRIDEAVMPEVTLVDMRTELKRGRRTVLSQDLQGLITETAAKKEQLIILLNRRGFSTFVLCRSCGYVVSCPNCTLPLVYHKSGRLQCHFCDTIEPIPDICPKCGSRYIKYFGTGTEKLEEELHQLFPELRIARMDRDTMSGKMNHVRLLDDFAAGRYDILLGTQMVAKGHDVKNVTGVGIISADSGLNLPDFRAAERCFALLTQAAGRAGRGNIQGRVVIQTYNPEHYAVVAAQQQDYKLFYQQEIALRRMLEYPPYTRLIKLIVQDKNEQRVMEKAGRLAEELQGAAGSAMAVLGPAEPSITQLRGIYRRLLILKIKDMQAVSEILYSQQLNLRTDVMIDVNPLNVM